MDDRITQRDLDGLKLLHSDDYIATIPETQQALEQAYVQGSQGWGVGQMQANLLRMAKELGRALIAEDKYDEAFKALKAEQMTRGRIQKQLDAAVDAGLNAETRAATVIADLEADVAILDAKALDES